MDGKRDGAFTWNFASLTRSPWKTSQRQAFFPIRGRSEVQGGGECGVTPTNTGGFYSQ